VVFLENVAGLMYRHKEVLNHVVAILEGFGYIVSWRLLDTLTHGGIPCRRKRIYIVGIKRPAVCIMPATCGAITGGMPATGGDMIVWPPPVQCIALSTILEDTPKVSDYNNYQYTGLGDTQRINLGIAVQRVMEKAA